MEGWPLARQGETVARLGRDCTNETAIYFSSIQWSSVGGEHSVMTLPILLLMENPASPVISHQQASVFFEIDWCSAFLR